MSVNGEKMAVMTVNSFIAVQADVHLRLVRLAHLGGVVAQVEYGGGTGGCNGW